MTGIPRLVAAWACAAALVSPLALAASDPDVEQLRKQVEMLQLRVDSLEAQIRLLSPGGAARPASTAAASAPAVAGTASAPTPAYEAAAEALVKDVVRLTDEGRPDEARAKLAELRSRYGGSKVAGQGTYFANEIDVIGKSVPADWGIQSWFQGEGAADLAGATATTIVVFFEEWCPHCREELPKLERLYTSHKARGLRVLGLTKVTETSTDDKVRAYLAANKIGFPVAKEAGASSSYFSVKGIPAAAIVKGGRIVWRGHPIRLTEDVVSHWLSPR
jgi:thiol-disulfide isomerase/thioredoxin